MSKVLVVEDEKILRDLMADELVKAGYEVKTAADGGEGWQLIQEFKPAVVLLDLLMPVMSGYDVLLKLRESPELKNIPCLVISNSGQIDDLNRAFTCGADDVLIKTDFNPDEVILKVKLALQKSV